MRHKSLLAAAALMLSGALPAFAQRLDTPGYTNLAFSGGLGTSDRNVGFSPVSSMTLSSASIYLDPLTHPTFTLVASLYSLTSPGSARTLIASSSQNFSDIGAGFYGVNLAASLGAGSYYDIGFDVVGGWNNNEYSMGFWIFNGPPVLNTAGTVMVLDGGYGSGTDAGWSNTITPDVCLNNTCEIGETSSSAPEPTSFVLAFTGLLGGVVVRRRRLR